MYIPKSFQFSEEEDKISFMKQYSFAPLITVKDGIPIATQLPFVVTQQKDKVVLSSHFSIANEQIHYLADNTHLVLFSEPHAYISPKHYDKIESVPTWDYIAVHAYGKAVIINGENEKIRLLEEMIQFYEPEYREQWNGLSDKFKKSMIKGIVAFEIEVTELQGQMKLSQNKNSNERQRITETLDKSIHGVEKELSYYMKKLNTTY